MILSILSPQVEIIGPGAISKANEGVLERVAARRIANGWGLTQLKSNTALVATEDCQLLGKHGWLLTQSNWTAVAVVDCEADVHAGTMKKHGLLIDIADRADLVHQIGWLVFVK